MGRTLPISEVKTHLPELLTGIEEREEEIVVTRKGKPAAVLRELRGVRASQGDPRRAERSGAHAADPAQPAVLRGRRTGPLLRRGLRRAAPTDAQAASVDGAIPARHPATRCPRHPPLAPRPEAQREERPSRPRRRPVR